MNLTPNFTLAELTASEAARRLRIDNTPGTTAMYDMRFTYVAQAGGAIGAMLGIEYALPLMLAGVAARPFVDRRRPLYG